MANRNPATDTMRSHHLPVLRRLCLTALAVLSTSCANDAGVRESQRLVAAGRPEEALKVVEAAAKAEPRRGEAYNAYIAQRTALVAAYLRDGETLRARNDLDGAETQYRNALRLDAMDDVARAGLQGLQHDRQLERQLTAATDALRRGDLVAADRDARAVLAQRSGHRGARAVLRELSDRQGRTDTAEPRLLAALARTISVELRDVPLRNVFEILSREGQLNFVLDRDVRTDARATIVVRDTNLDDVLKMLLLTNQLERRILNGNSLLIYPATANKQKDYQELVVRSFYLANADAKQTAAMIRAMVKSKDIFVDEKLNLLIVRDTPDAIRLAEQLVATQDLPEPEVMLEVEVLEVASSLVQEFGVNLPTQIGFGQPGGGADGSSLPSPIQLGAGTVLRAFVANPVLALNLRRQDGTSNLLANPRIRVKNREKAKIHIGERVPVITTTSTANVGVSSSVNYLETGLKLDVEPNIFLEDEVSIKVQLEVSNILEQLNVAGTVSYRLGTRNAATTLRLKDGETQVLAGLINNEDRRSVAKVPFLGEVPLLGRLFRNDNDQTVKSEIVLLITPRIVRNLSRPDHVPAQMPSGTDGAPGAPPLRLSSTADFRALSSQGGTPPRGAASLTPPSAAGQSLPLVVAAPTLASPGEEFTMQLTLLAGNEAVAALVELNFDPAVLALLQGPAAPAAGPRAATGTSAADPGHVALEVNSAGVAGVPPVPVPLRFKVIATRPTQTAINIQVTSKAGNVSAPSQHTLTVANRAP